MNRSFSGCFMRMVLLYLSSSAVIVFCFDNIRITSSSAKLCNKRHSSTASFSHVSQKRSIAIVGGGLAGLSVAYQLLSRQKEYSPNGIKITILDQSREPGIMGASSVAGGLLHPFTPRGKLVHLGKEGLEISNSLLSQASKFEQTCILRDQMFRVALSSKHVDQLNETATSYPEYSTSMSAQEIKEACGANTMGGLKLENGCKVVHVPSYLRGLLKACQDLDVETTWTQVKATTDIEFKSAISKFDTIVLSAGSGLMIDNILSSSSLPVTLVRGQSVELKLDADEIEHPLEAVLCGKYVSPLIDEGKMLIGATHEYKDQALSNQDVEKDLLERSVDLAPSIWESGKVSRITSGWRVQSERGASGRIPIVGRLDVNTLHNNVWIFTGLGSRGLIHHGVYGSVLSEAILRNDESVIYKKIPQACWWKDKA